MTFHCGMNRKTADRIKKNPRLTNIVSRGGSLLFAWMEMNNQENPFYEYYDRLLDISEKYEVTLSLGNACRPGCTHDATDAAQIEELMKTDIVKEQLKLLHFRNVSKAFGFDAELAVSTEGEIITFIWTNQGESATLRANLKTFEYEITDSEGIYA